MPVDYMTQQQQQDPRTTSRVNALRQLMDFYAQNGPQNNSSVDSVANANNNRAAAMQFAQQQMQQEPSGDQNFFGQSQGPAYVPPRSVQDMSRDAGFPLAPQDQLPPVQGRSEIDRAGMARNFLANLFNRR